MPSGSNERLPGQGPVLLVTLPSWDCHCWCPWSLRKDQWASTHCWAPRWFIPPSVGAWGWEMNLPQCPHFLLVLIFLLQFSQHLSGIAEGQVPLCQRHRELLTRPPTAPEKGAEWPVAFGLCLLADTSPSTKAKGPLKGKKPCPWAEEQGVPGISVPSAPIGSCWEGRGALCLWPPCRPGGTWVCNCQRAVGTHRVLWLLQDLSGWLEGTTPAQDEWRSMIGTSGKLSVTPTLVPKLPTWSAESCSVAQPCLSPGQLTLEKGLVPCGTESCSVWGMNPFSAPAPRGPPGTSPAPTRMLPVSPAHVRTQGRVLPPGVCR